MQRISPLAARQGAPAAILASLVLLCSCRSVPLQNANGTAAARHASVEASAKTIAAAGQQRQAGGSPDVGQACPQCAPGTLPPFAFTGAPAAELGLAWAPPGINRPWPPDEYVCDGGDANWDAQVKPDRTVVGLDERDTIAHYQTRDGRTEISASNCVCIYAPRFAAVRQVTTPILQEGHERMADVVLPSRPVIHEEKRGAKSAVQPEQLIAQIGLDQPQRLGEQNRGLVLEQATRLVLAADALLPYENLLLIERGQFQAREASLLEERVAAAIAWTGYQTPQVLIGGQPAVEVRGTATPQLTYTYELKGKGCLRLCKIADKSEAKSGDIVQFTLRFDNVGDQPIGSVTIIDHLAARLAYVEGSAQSSLPARFATQEQVPGESLVLRWELEEPLAVNQGGIVRFQARVR